MITRTTLKALWIGGGGVLATWLAVSPNQGVPAAPDTAHAPSAVERTPGADELAAQADQLRARTRAVTLQPSTRNPFRFGSRKSPAPPAPRSGGGEVTPSLEAPEMPAALPPSLVLSGVAQKAGTRTAVISGDGQIYLAREGDLVAGRYTVVKIDPEAVLLRDAAGAELRLVLPQ